MFDFSFTEAAETPIPLRINGTLYNVPRFSDPNFKEWAAIYEAKRMESALAEIKDPKDRAQMRLWLDVPPTDVARVAESLRTVEGVEFVIRKCFGGVVPEKATEYIIAQTAKPALLTVADELSKSRVIAQRLNQEAGGTDSDPKASTSDGSGASLATGPASSSDSNSPTPA